MAFPPSRSLSRPWLGLALVATAAAATLWVVAPAVVRLQVERLAARYGLGTVAIDRVVLHGLAPIELRGVTLRGDRGEAVARCESITVVVQELNWRGPVASRLEIHGVTLRPEAPAGGVFPPMTMAGSVATPYRGALHLDGWRIDYGDAVIAQEISADLQVRDGRLTLDGPAGSLLGGRLEARMVLESEADVSGSASGTLSVTTLAIATLTPLLPADERLPTGSATVELDLRRDAEAGWAINGRLQMVEADLRGVTLARKLCHFLGVKDLTPLARADAEIAFALTGTAATITRGRLASGLPEMAIEPGSRIDLATGRIDASVVLAAGARLGELPLLHPVATLVKSLTRIRIHGQWQDPEEALFSRD